MVGRSESFVSALSGMYRLAEDALGDVLGDEPLDAAAVHADDALIESLAHRCGTGPLPDDDPLIAMLGAWRAHAQAR